MLLQQDQPDWPQHLSLICQAYRGLPVASTGYSPYESLFGFPMRLPIDLMKSKPPNVKITSPCKEYPLLLREHLWEIHNEIRKNIQFAVMRMKTVTIGQPTTYLLRSVIKSGYSHQPEWKEVAPRYNHPGLVHGSSSAYWMVVLSEFKTWEIPRRCRWSMYCRQTGKLPLCSLTHCYTTHQLVARGSDPAIARMGDQAECKRKPFTSVYNPEIVRITISNCRAPAF